MWATGLSTGILAGFGCAHVPNQFVEDGPAATAELESASARQVFESYGPAAQQHRDWAPSTVNVERGVVYHWPLYMENPFMDKGHGRTGRNVYYLGWEDGIAAMYAYPRYTLNWLAFPISAVVTPPWTITESDGVISRQLLGYDHDAAPSGAPSLRETDSPLDALRAEPPEAAAETETGE